MSKGGTLEVLIKFLFGIIVPSAGLYFILRWVLTSLKRADKEGEIEDIIEDIDNTEKLSKKIKNVDLDGSKVEKQKVSEFLEKTK